MLIFNNDIGDHNNELLRFIGEANKTTSESQCQKASATLHNKWWILTNAHSNPYIHQIGLVSFAMNINQPALYGRPHSEPGKRSSRQHRFLFRRNHVNRLAFRVCLTSRVYQYFIWSTKPSPIRSTRLRCISRGIFQSRMFLYLNPHQKWWPPRSNLSLVGRDATFVTLR